MEERIQFIQDALSDRFTTTLSQISQCHRPPTFQDAGWTMNPIIPIAEVADIVDSTVGGVKAALHRARTKLTTMKAAPPVAVMDGEQRRLFEAYAEVFKRRDWDALKQLVRADARLEIVGAAEGIMSGLGATYSTNYTALKWEWRLSPGVVDGVPVIVHWRRDGNTWRPHAAIRLWWRDCAVVRIRDYIHVDYLLTDWASASSA